MILKMIRAKNKDHPIEINRGTFFRTKILLWGYFLAWLGLLFYLYLEWSELNSFMKYSLAIFEGIFAPEIGIFRVLIERYDQYQLRIRNLF